MDLGRRAPGRVRRSPRRPHRGGRARRAGGRGHPGSGGAPRRTCVEQRHQAGELLAAHHLGVDAEMLVHLGPPARGAHGRIRVREREVPALRIEDVEVELLAEAAVEPHRFLVEGDAFGGQVVGADDGGVAAGVAAAEIALVEHGDVAHAVARRQVIGGGEPVPAAADDRHVVARPQLRPGAEEALHRPPPGEAVFQETEGHRWSSSLKCSRLIG